MSSLNPEEFELEEHLTIEDAYNIYRWNGDKPHLVDVEILEEILDEETRPYPWFNSYYVTDRDPEPDAAEVLALPSEPRPTLGSRILDLLVNVGNSFTFKPIGKK